MIENLILGATGAFTPMNILIAFVGVTAGIIFGALPGFTPSMGIAVLLPFSYSMNAEQALILLGALYCGAFYGGSISAILVNTPGTPAAAATALDGYPMSRQGRAQEALTEAAIASTWGGVISLVAVFLIAAPLARLTLHFGMNENFLLAIFGLTIIASLSKENMVQNLIGGVLGLMIACVGSDPMTGVTRYTFGIPELLTGVNLTSALIGLYSIPQIVSMAMSKERLEVDREAIKAKSKFDVRDFWRYPVDYIRSAIIGIVIGIIPGPGGNTASWLAYSQGKIYKKASDECEFGEGCRRGIACSEAANNGVTGGSMIPMLALGIPGNAVSAVLMSGLMIKGLSPGWDLFDKHADITYTFIMGLLVANIMMLIIGIVAAKYVSFVAMIPNNILGGCVAVLSLVGAFAVNNSMMNIYIVLVMGLFGMLLKKMKFDSTPVILGMILGNLAERSIGQSLLVNKTYGGVVGVMLQRPLSIILIVLIIIMLAMPFVQSTRDKKKAARKEVAK